MISLDAVRRGWAAAVRHPAVSHPAVISMAVTAFGAIVWVAVFPRVGTDLSAGIARAGWAAHYPGSAYVFSWYGGIYPASYSVLAPYVLAVVGTRLAMAAAVVITAGLLGWLFARHAVPRPRAAALWVAVALWTELSAGRAAFTLGLAAAAGCVAAADMSVPAPAEGRVAPAEGRVAPADTSVAAAAEGCVATAGHRRPRGWPRWLAVAGLAFLSSLLSPVAGLFLLVPALALLITGRRREGLVMGVAAAVPLAITALVPGGGAQPIGWQNWLPSLLAAVGVIAFVPRRWRVVRAGAAVYAVGVLAASAVPTPVGSNVERLGLLLVGPLLAGMGSARYRPLLAVGLVAAVGWLIAQPAVDLAHGNAAPYAPQTAALVHELRALHADTARVEAVPQYGHWESQELAGTVWLARGWQRQADMARNPLFYRSGTLTPAEYYHWLRANAVRYVAISRAAPDWAAVAEDQLVRAGQPWLAPVWHDAFWQVYRVAGTEPLASAPATVLGTTPAQIAVLMSRPGTAIVRVHWSPLLRSTGGAALARHGPWTSLTARRPGRYTLTAPY